MKAQHGFREGKSTITALNELKNLVRNTLEKYKYSAMISTDIGGTFDRLNWFVISEVVDDLQVFDYLKSTLKN